MKGCIELCCDTKFTYSTQRGKSGDIGQITRPKPQDCYNCCRMLCTQVDFYTVEYVTPFPLFSLFEFRMGMVIVCFFSILIVPWGGAGGQANRVTSWRP